MFFYKSKSPQRPIILKPTYPDSGLESQNSPPRQFPHPFGHLEPAPNPRVAQLTKAAQQPQKRKAAQLLQKVNWKSPETQHRPHLFTDNLTVGRHSAPRLASLVMTWSKRRGSNLNPRQQAALHCYRQEEIYKITKMDKYKEENILTAYFNLFNGLYFGGTLIERCTVKLSPKSSRQAGMQGDCATAWKCRSGNEDITITCNITVFTESELADRRLRLLCHIGTLLHEMAHAFLDIWGCLYKPCGEQVACVGKSHGFAWQDIAFAVARASQDKEFLGLPVRLGRCDSLFKEFKGRERELSTGLLRRWGMDGKWLKLDNNFE